MDGQQVWRENKRVNKGISEHGLPGYDRKWIVPEIILFLHTLAN